LKNSDMKTQELTNPTAYSDRIISTLYSTKVTATGGRHGHIRSEDGLLEMKLALPRELGGKGDATNALAVSVTGVDQETAEDLAESAHKICPYSNAIRGNVEVGITVSAR
jgi:lipoyl-dependent peroxiredoxin